MRPFSLLAHPLRALGLALGLTLAAAPLAAQGGAPADTAAQRARADSARTLAPVRVEVTRADLSTDRVAWAVGTLSSERLRGARATLGVDEALASIPGVVVSNRYNYALDQRLSIRGAGSRANFGMRGVKVLLDGIPQSLPDGQSQLTNVDLAAIERVEVLRGSASSLYGNGSGGVISFTSDLSAPERLGASLRLTTGSFGLAKTQGRVSGRVGSTIGSLSVSRTTVDGFRMYSAADTRQLLGALDHALGGVRLSLRAGTAETPRALNPGALTPTEFALNPDSAAATNIRRGASREVSQRYVSLRGSGRLGDGTWSASVYGQRRFVDNALAVPPPAPAGPANGTYSTLDRQMSGMRLDASNTLGGPWRPRLSAGLDLQRSHDVRRNQRSTAGRPSAPEDTLLLDQNEVVTSMGPFAQVQLDPHAQLTLSAGARWDRLAFRVEDHFLGDGDDDSGERTMTAASGHLGAVWRAGAAFAPYANIATAFETPTTTELQVRPGGVGGFNPDLGPQRIRTIEVGARGRIGARASYEAALFDVTARDAIVQYLETSGRAFFENAGRTRARGVELGVRANPSPWAQLHASWTHATYEFLEYRVPSSTQPAPALDTLDGNQLAGVPRDALRFGASATWRSLLLEGDHTWQGALWADDRNLVRVPSWHRGQLNLRAAWRGTMRGWKVEPFAGVQNLFNQSYVGAVTLNGAFARVLEPAPRVYWYAGIALGAPLVR